MTDATERMTLSTLTDLVEVVPVLLGFHAHDSLALIAIQDGKVELTARTDLTNDAATRLSAAWRRLPRAELVLIAYTADEDRAWLGLGEVDDALPDGTDRILLHADGACWFAHPQGVGTPYDVLGSVHLARAAFSGRQVRASREELARLVEPSRSPDEVTASLERVAAEMGTLSDVVAEALALLEGHDDEPGDLDIDDATVLCLASHEESFLDAALLSTVRENAGARLSLWLQVVGASVPNCAGGALVAAGLAAWLTGDGALQSVCLEALAERPGPVEWVSVLDGINRDALPPSGWDALCVDLLADRLAVQPQT